MGVLNARWHRTHKSTPQCQQHKLVTHATHTHTHIAASYVMSTGHGLKFSFQCVFKTGPDPLNAKHCMQRTQQQQVSLTLLHSLRLEKQKCAKEHTKRKEHACGAVTVLPEVRVLTAHEGTYRQKGTRVTQLSCHKQFACHTQQPIFNASFSLFKYRTVFICHEY